MPNWCSNRVDFIGSEEDILSFRESLVETKPAQDLASARAMVMLVQETLEPGTLKEMNLAILRKKMKENAPIDEQLFDTINHLWNDFDLTTLSETFEEVWKKINVDWVVSHKERSLKGFLEYISKDIPYASKLNIETDFMCGTKSYLDFAQFVPLPFMSSLLGFNSQTENWLRRYVTRLPSNKYDAQTNLWGTKWNATDVYAPRDQVEGGFSLCFATAWSPPIPIFDEISAQNPNLTLDVSFSEPGCNYCGRYVWIEGELMIKLQGEMEWIEDDEGDHSQCSRAVA